MAQGDLSVFDEALLNMLKDFVSTDNIKVALITNATVPAVGDTTPDLGDYTEVTAGGNYAAGGEALNTWGNMLSEAAGTVTFDDTDASVTWAQHASNPTNAYYAIIYNDTDAGDACIAFIDLGGAVDMTAGDLTITWDASGIFTVTVS